MTAKPNRDAVLEALVERLRPNIHLCNNCHHSRGEHAMDLVGDHFCEQAGCSCENYVGVTKPSYGELAEAVREAALQSLPEPVLDHLSAGDSTATASGLPGVGRFRKKPVVIEAARWFKNGDHPLDYNARATGFEKGKLRDFTGGECKANNWEGQVVRYFRKPDVSGTKECQHCGKAMQAHGWIDTKEGGHIVCPGAWFITGVAGERYPCKPDIFAATYEVVP